MSDVEDWCVKCGDAAMEQDNYEDALCERCWVDARIYDEEELRGDE